MSSQVDGWTGVMGCQAYAIFLFIMGHSFRGGMTILFLTALPLDKNMAASEE